MPTVASLINQLQHMNPDSVIAYDLWVIDDIDDLREDNDLTDGEKEDVLHFMDKGKDATIGLTWDVLDANIDWVISLRKEDKE